MSNNKYILQSVDNTLKVLELLSKKPNLGVGEIGREMGLGKATAFRILSTLENRNFVKKTSNAKYQLGLKFAYFGSIVQMQIDYVNEIRPFLTELRDTFNETAHTAMLDEYEIVFLDKVLGNTTIQMSSRIGAKLPAYCTGTGKVLMAQKSLEEIEAYLSTKPLKEITQHTITSESGFMDEMKIIREEGYSKDLEESEIGLVCYAVPIYDYTNEVVLAISISGPSVRMRQNHQHMVKAILDIKKRASKALGSTFFD